MRYNKLLLFFLSLVFSCSAFSLSNNMDFKEGAQIQNYSSQPILVNEDKFWMFDKRLEVNDEYDVTVSAANKFAALNGQSIGHTFIISSAVDNSLICVVKSNLNITLSGGVSTQPTNNNEARCEVGSFINYKNEGEEVSNIPTYGTSITVK